MPDLARVLDLLRVAFPYIIAVVFPLAGLILAIVRFVDSDRDDAIRIAAAALLGSFLYLLLVF